MSTRIEFYKNRSIGERFSVAIDFLKQNWKVLYKNILWGALPLALMMGYLLARQQTFVSPALGFSYNLIGMFVNLLLIYLIGFINMIYMYSMTCAILLHYDRNQLTESTGWNDLKIPFFQFAGKTFLITLIVILPLIAIIALFTGIFVSFFSAFSPSGGAVVGVMLLIGFAILLLFGVLIAIAPSFTILYFPAFFSGKSVWKSIKTAFVLGFKNWASLFVAIILTVLVFMIVYLVFSVPFEVLSLIMRGRVGIITYILGIFSAVGSLLTYPIMVLIFAFQYFSIVEKEEGVSLQSQLSDFENL